MWAPAVVEAQVTADRGAGLADAVVGPQIDLLVLDAAPQALDEYVVAPSSLAVHADRNAVTGERAGERPAGELRALVRVEDVRLAVTGHSILQRCAISRARSCGRRGLTATPSSWAWRQHEALLSFYGFLGSPAAPS